MYSKKEINMIKKVNFYGCSQLSRELTIESTLRFFMKLRIVAVFEVPESPTRRTGLFILIICPKIQLHLVVSIVGTRKNQIKMS